MPLSPCVSAFSASSSSRSNSPDSDTRLSHTASPVPTTPKFHALPLPEMSPDDRFAAFGALSLRAAHEPMPASPRSVFSAGSGAAVAHAVTPPRLSWCPEVKPLLTESIIRARVEELGRRITDDYRDKQAEGVVFLPVLHGAKMFTADLERHIALLGESTGVRLKSYGNAKESSGRVEMTLSPELDLEGKHLLVIEDIVDTGQTMDLFLKVLQNFRPASVEVATLLTKPCKHLVDIHPKYVGFEIDDEFVVGYGLDYQQRYRNLPFIGTI